MRQKRKPAAASHATTARRSPSHRVELIESEARYRAIFEQAADAIVVIDPETLAIVDFNDAAHRQLGYSRREFSRLKISDVEVVESAADIRNHSRSVAGRGVHVFETKHRTRGGDVLDVEIRAKAVRIGGRRLIQGIWRDITARKIAGETLRKSETLLGQTERISRTGGWEYDVVRKKNIWTEETYRIHGVTRETFNPDDLRKVSGFYPHEDRRRLLKSFQAAIDDGIPYDLELQFRRADGREMWVRVSGQAERKGGRVVRVFGNIVDITDAKLAAGDLMKSQALLDQTQRISLVGGWEYNVVTKKSTWTDETYRIHGVSRETYDPSNVRQDMSFYPGGDERRMMQAFGDAVSKGCPYDLELRFRSATGRNMWVRAIGQVERKNGRILRVFGNIMDITERKQAEGALRLSEYRYRLFAEHASDVVWIMDMDGRFTYVSPATQKLRGYTSEEVLNQPLEQQIAPGSLPTAIDAITKLIEAGRSGVTGFSMVREIEQLRKDGSGVWTEVVCDIVGDAEKGSIVILGVTRDITERRESERALRKLTEGLERRVDERTAELKASEARYRALVEQVPGVTYVASLDDASSTLYISPQVEGMLGFKAEEFSAITDLWSRQLYPEDRERIKLEVQKLHQLRQPAVLEYRIRRRDGRTIWVTDRAVVVNDSAGRPAVLQGIMHDITARKKAEQDLHVLAEVAGELLGVETEDDLFRHVGQRVRELTGAGVVAVNVADDRSGRIMVRHLSGLDEKHCRDVGRLLGISPQDMSFERLTDEAREGLSTGRLMKIEGGLWDAMLRKVPKASCERIEHVLGIRDAYSVGLRRNRNVFGSLTLLLPPGHTFNMSAVEAIAGQFSVAIERKRSEKALQDGMKRLETTLNAARVVAWELDPASGSLVETGPVAEMFDKPAGFLHHTLAEFFKSVHPDDRDKLRDEMETAMRSRADVSASEFRLPLHGGGVRWIEVSGSIERDTGGRPLLLRGITREITRQRQSEAALRESESRFRAMFENSPIGMVLGDLDGRVLESNPAMEHMLGFSKEELRGKLASDFTHPDDLTEESRLVGSVLAGKRKSFRIEKRYIRKDASVITVLLHGTLVRDEAGKPLIGVALVEDITQRKRAEEALSESEARFRAVFVNSPIGMMLGNREQRVVESNPAMERMLGYTKKGLKGKCASEFTHPDDLAIGRAEVADLLARRRKSFQVQKRYVRQDRKVIMVRIHGTIVRDKSGLPLVGVALVEDITKRAQAEVELASLQRQVLEISERERRRIGQDLHDGVGQSLTGIRYLISAVQQSLSDRSAPEAVELERISQMVGKTVQRTHDLARGLFPGELRKDGFADALRELAIQTRDVFGISCRFSGPQFIMMADDGVSYQLFRIAQEAVHNAARHSRTRRLSIRLSEHHGRLVLTIRDEGVGMPKHAGQTTGLGQRIMRHRADMIGAILKIKSAAGRGTTVTCELPMNRCHKEADR